MRWTMGVAAALAAAGFVSGANAVILSPVSATASNTFNIPTVSIDATIDQSGLRIGGVDASFVSGTDDIDVFLAKAPTHALNYDTKWFSEDGVTAAGIVYDLGSSYSLQKMAIWVDETSGIGSFNLSVSEDGISYKQLLTDASVIDIPEFTEATAQVWQFPGSGSANARFVKLDVGDCPQSGPYQFCGIGEVAFGTGEPDDGSNPPDPTTAVPLPATFLLLGTGMIGAGLWSRRRRA
jgi:hypothetical protein